MATTKATKKTAPASNGLRKPQLRVLATLAKSKEEGLTRARIAKRANVDLASLTEYIGSSNKERRLKNDAKMSFRSLISLGFVKPTEVDGVTSYGITDKGRKALAAK